jgi:selenocysteine lyase/cysteine desulfurase
VLAPDETAFEDGTVNFLSIPDVEFGLDWVDSIGMELIGCRTRCLTGWLLDRLTALRHGDGSPMVRVYGPVGTEARGATVAFNFLDGAGRIVDERLVAADTTAARISLRTGCFCNPGAGEDAFGLDLRALRPLRGARTRSLDEYLRLIGLPTGGAVRVSLGLASTAADVERFVTFAQHTYRDRITDSADLPPRDRC